MSDSPGSLGEGIVYEDEIPVSLRQVDALSDLSLLATLDSRNERTLRLLSALEEYYPESAEEHFGQGYDLPRLDFKLNLLLELVGQILASHLDLPPSRKIRLTAGGVEWPITDEEHPEADTPVVVALHLHAHLPNPLELPGTIARDGAADRIRVLFKGMNESVHELLEKLIFRHHRRSIANLRPLRER